MSLTQSRWHNMRLQMALAIVFLTLGLGAVASVAQKKLLPGVTSASVPIYPVLPQQAGIEGVVRLRISTDGGKASSIEVESGQPLLAQAAKDNVKTWQFKKHSPTTFETTFRFNLLPAKCDSECNCDSLEEATILLRLPTGVEVSAKRIILCDPAVVIKH